MNENGRRWHAGDRETVSGVDFRVTQGRKAPTDLRIEWRTASGWMPVDMAAVFVLVDFFADNERALQEYRPHWRVDGDVYFLRNVKQAGVKGWRHPSDELRKHRDNRADAIQTVIFGDDE
jgi:hypothetical protein